MRPPHTRVELGHAVGWHALQGGSWNSIICYWVAAYIPIECKPCYTQEEDESTPGNPFPASSLECTCSNSFLFSSLEKGVIQCYRGTDKSLARRRRKQTTATKLFASHSKKFRRLSVEPGLRSSNDLHVGQKMATFQLFFFFFSRFRLRTYQHRCNFIWAQFFKSLLPLELSILTANWCEGF